MRDRQTRTCKDAFQSIERQVIGVLRHQHPCKQRSGRDALVDHLRWNRRLYQRLARLAHPLAADMPLDREHAGRIVQLLADVLADAYALATTRAGRVVRFMMDVGARELRRQWGAFRLLTRLAGPLLRLQRFELGLNRRQICVDRFVEQAHLLFAELLAVLAELLPLDDRQLVRELVDPRLPIPQLPLLLTDFALLLPDLDDQRRGQRAELFGTEGVEVGWQIHGSQSARRQPDTEAKPFTSGTAS
ncbi:hypothetical protein X942_5546 [Burkholderia pseudomallei MSHR5596]|nr:hypothetical protein X942_5546 [Burkholderia pseudomallei MSHR5596]